MIAGILLPTVAGALGLLAVSAVGLLRHEGRVRAQARRVMDVMAPYSPAPRPGAIGRSARRGSTAPRSNPLAGVAALLKIETDRRDLYPVAPWVLLLAALGAATAVAWLGTLIVGRVGWLDLPVAAAVFTRSLFGRFRRRYTDALYRQLPDALAMIVRAVRAGVPVAESFRTVARESPEPTSGEFVRLCDEIFVGVPMERALVDLASRTAMKEYGFFAVALALQRQTGGNLTEALENLADVIRKRVRLRARAAALTSEARTSALVLAAVPVVAGGALAAINPEYIMTLLRDPMGKAILGAAVLSLASGAATMRVIIQKTLA